MLGKVSTCSDAVLVHLPVFVVLFVLLVIRVVVLLVILIVIVIIIIIFVFGNLVSDFLQNELQPVQLEGDVFESGGDSFLGGGSVAG